MKVEDPGEYVALLVSVGAKRGVFHTSERRGVRVHVSLTELRETPQLSEEYLYRFSSYR